MSIPVTGFVDQNGAIRKYDYASLENAPVARGTGTNSLIEVHTTLPNIASESSSVAIGGGNQSIASGAVTIGTNNIASAQNAVAIGSKLAGADPNTASAPSAIALGLSCAASGYGSVAVGYNTTASNTGSFSTGYQTTSSGQASVAAGYLSTASGTASAAIGQEATASATGSVAVGRGTTASAAQAFAAGRNTTAEAVAATALGYGTDATGARSLVAGAYNEPDANEVDTTHGSGTRKYLMIIGNGTADNARSNAATLDWDGNLEVAGDVVTKDGSFSELKSAIENLEAIPHSVKMAMDTLFSKAAYADDDAASSYATFHAWAISNPVTSITAVFTQGDSVFGTNNNLDDLRTNLVVTATYSDSTTAVVTDYTLSGTLTRGTSTITVSYGGKTSTFTVNVVTWVVTPDDLVIAGLTANPASDTTGLYPYTITNYIKRLSYYRFDLMLEAGKTYQFTTTTAVNTAEMGIQAYNQTILDHVANNTQFADSELDDTGWGAITRTYTMPTGYLGVRFTYRESSSNPNITTKFVTRVIIDEVV